MCSGSWLLLLGSNQPSDYVVQRAIERLSELGTVQLLGAVQHLPPRSGEGCWYYNTLLVWSGDITEAALRQLLCDVEQVLGRDRATPMQVAIDIDVLACYRAGWIADPHALEKKELEQYPANKLIADAGLVIQQRQ